MFTRSIKVMSHCLIMLIGPKGVGKSYIGNVLHMHTDMHFIYVEDIWLNLQPDENGWDKVSDIIDEAFKKHNRVVIESLGAGSEFDQFHLKLAAKYKIKMVRIWADLETCFKRTQLRDDLRQLPIAPDKIRTYNKIADTVKHEWDAEISNDPPLSIKQILDAFARL